MGVEPRRARRHQYNQPQEQISKDEQKKTFQASLIISTFDDGSRRRLLAHAK
jgi:hypothetical protein